MTRVVAVRSQAPEHDLVALRVAPAARMRVIPAGLAPLLGRRTTRRRLDGHAARGRGLPASAGEAT